MRQIRPVHPGEVISDMLEDLEMTQTSFAELLGVSRRTVNEFFDDNRQNAQGEITELLDGLVLQ